MGFGRLAVPVRALWPSVVICCRLGVRPVGRFLFFFFFFFAYDLPWTFAFLSAPGDPRVRFFVFLWCILHMKATSTCAIRPNRAIYST